MADERVEIQAITRTLTQDVTRDGTVSTIRKNRVGELVVAPSIDQLIIDGDVFMCSNAARETATDIGRKGTFLDTEPAFAIDVPAGHSIKPLEFEFRQGGTVANATFTALITADTAIRITSGTDVAINNFRINADPPKVTKCTAKTHSEAGTNLVVGANTEDFTLWGGLLVNDLDALKGGHLLYSYKEHITPWLVGPACFAVYLYVATAEPQGFWHFIYAEKSTAELAA